MRAFYAAMVLLIPFLISAAFYYSPYLGWPVAFVGGVYWLGCCLVIAEKEQPK